MKEKEKDKSCDSSKRWSPGSSFKMALSVIVAAAIYAGLAYMPKAGAQEVVEAPEVVIESTPESSVQADTAILNDPVGQPGKKENVAPAASQEVSEVSSAPISCVFSYDFEKDRSVRVWSAIKLLKSHGCATIPLDKNGEIVFKEEVVKDDK